MKVEVTQVIVGTASWFALLYETEERQRDFDRYINK